MHLLNKKYYLFLFIGLFFFISHILPSGIVTLTEKACASTPPVIGYFSRWGPNCPGVDDHHKQCPSGIAYPYSTACIDSVGITVPIVVQGLRAGNGSIKIKAHAKGPGTPGWENACVAAEVRCLLREAESTDQAVATDDTYYFFIDPIGCTSGRCDDTFSITAVVDTNGTAYSCVRTDDKLVDLNKNGQAIMTPPVGISCSLPVTETCNSYCDTTIPTCTANGKLHYATTKKCVKSTGEITYTTQSCGTTPDSGPITRTCEITVPTLTLTPTQVPNRPTNTPTPSPTAPISCPAPAQVPNVQVSCPYCQ